MNRPRSLLAVLALSIAAAPAHAAPRKKAKPAEDAAAAPAAAPPPAGAAPAAPAAPGAPAAPTPEQQQATAEFHKGQELQTAGDLDGAIAQYEKAFALYPDPELQFLLGEVHRTKGDQSTDFAEYAKAVTCFKKYLEMAPEGRAAAAAKQRIAALEEGIAKNDAARAEEEAAAKQAAAEEAEAKARAEQDGHDRRGEGTNTKLAIDVSLIAGTEPALTGIARLALGGLIGWGRFAFEGHVGFGGFLRASDGGVSARELTVIDLGARYAFSSGRFVGPFVGVGGSFGLITGKPRERRLVDDEATCGGTTCAIAIDKDLTARLAFGYGFASSDRTTVALRVDLTYMMFSVDDEQNVVPASQVERPQGFPAILFGLEFMHWP